MDINSVTLHGIDESTSPYAICSLPALPGRGGFSVSGARTQTVPVGFWPHSAVNHPGNVEVWKKHGWQTPAATGGEGRWPRRLLTIVDFGEAPPGETRQSFSVDVEESLTRYVRGAEFSPTDATTGWTVQTTEEPFIQRKDETWAHTCTDVDARLLLEFSGSRCDLRLGWQTESNVRAWQWINAERLWSGPLAEAWQIGGHLYAGASESRLTNEQAARWFETPQAAEQMIFAQLYLVLFANGAVDCRAHFVNGELYGRGGFVAGRPLISFTTEERFSAGDGAPDESGAEWRLISQFQKPFGGDDAAAFIREGAACHWLPFADTTQVLGLRHEDEAPMIVEESLRGFPRGVARTAHFGLSVRGARLPARYLPSPDYTLLAGEWGVALDPGAEGPEGFEDLTALVDAARRVFVRNAMAEGFSYGGTFRYLDHYPDKRWEFSCDGNETASLFRGAYATLDKALYELALANADYNADLNCDHTQFTWHYHEAQPHREIFSLIYMRFAGLVQAHLETGDPYYLDTAEAVANRWISTHRANWPRRGVGRDAEPVEGILALYDFTGEEYYLSAARKIALDVVASLYENGAWRSGSGSGPFWGTNALPGTPWNGAHLLSGLAEFLLRTTPDDPTWPRLTEGGRRLLHHTLELLEGPEYSGFHRTSMAYAWRRHFSLSLVCGDDELKEGVRRALSTALGRFRTEGEAFFLYGHHCAGYLDHAWFFRLKGGGGGG